ncbi:fibronectin type III domain-containing protein [Arthrobacter sp. I2-34]|uniref:Fibronectin type III domain-containing protein n=1 Tax=Arthrobacter hankyongi TaxID=2904801 RepID=A0ABS9L6G7_9MICC|nr:endonuclease/exonuclease/phosphatase family protein [Arthrobacter hankyongi]MCG2622269.1 fibronectin type III domain-containing protein [Arthrobacter hankyongi]
MARRILAFLAAVLLAGGTLHLTAPAASAASLARPTGLSVTEVNYESFVFSWRAVAGATSYTGKLATNSTFTSGVQYFQTSKTTRKPINLKNCTTYYFKVKANKGSSTSSSYSDTKKVTLKCFWPREFTRIKAVPKSGSSIGLSWTRPEYATRFEIWRSTASDFTKNLVKVQTSKDWYVDENLSASKPGKSYYYRILAFNKSNTTNVRYSPKFEANLKPAVPSGVKVARTSPNGATLTWSTTWNARQYEVRAATDAAFTSNVKTLTTSDGRNRLTFNTLASGKKYYFQVRAVNGLKQNIARSAYSSTVSGTTSGTGVPLTVMSFNVLSAKYDGGVSSRSWNNRKPAIAATIGSSGADVVGVQEAYASDDYPGGDGVTPQWEDLRKILATKGYRRALTGTDGLYAYSQCGKDGCWRDEYQLDGNHIFYKSATVKPVGNGGKISLPNPDDRGSGYTASWQVFEKLDSKARFIAVDTHLYAAGITTRGTNESNRVAQVTGILDTLKQVNTASLPVVLLGDLNSHESHKPISTLLTGGFANTAGLDVPQTKANFNSSHGFQNPPPSTFGTQIDYVMVSNDIAAKKWELVANIDPATGRFTGTIPSDHHAIKAVVTLPQ